MLNASLPREWTPNRRDSSLLMTSCFRSEIFDTTRNIDPLLLFKCIITSKHSQREHFLIVSPVASPHMADDLALHDKVII